MGRKAIIYKSYQPYKISKKLNETYVRCMGEKTMKQEKSV